MQLWVKKCPFPEVTELQNRETDRQNQRARQSETFPDRPSLFVRALLCPLPQLKEERWMRHQQRDKLTMKSRGRSRGWLSARWERRVGKTLKKKKKRKKDHDGSLHWRVAERQAGEVQHILRQKGTLGLWNIHSSQLETETRSDRAEEGPEDWRDSTTPPKHTLLKIKYTDTFLMTSHEEPGGVVRVSFSSFI